MKMQPRVSVVVPTRNSAATLEACLKSVRDQTYDKIDLIVVDNHSTDDTPIIAKRFTKKFYTKGPERCQQRNFGASKADGEFVVFIDSDMELTPDVIAEAVSAYTKRPVTAGVVIHEESFGTNFWARCKALERSFYVNVPWIEAARFMRRRDFDMVGGYDTTLVSGEDWDLSQRLAEYGPIVAIEPMIRHNEGTLKLGSNLRKKYYYAQHAAAYLNRHPEKSLLGAQNGPIARYTLFLTKPTMLAKRPVIGIGMILMKTLEFGAGLFGYTRARYTH